MFFALFLVFNLQLVRAETEASPTWEQIVTHTDLQITQSDVLVYDHFLQIYKIASKGYASNYLIDKGLKDSIRSPRFSIFHEWLLDLKGLPELSYEQTTSHCLGLSERLRTTFGMARKLLLQRLSFCRQLGLQKMVPQIQKAGGLSPNDLSFLKRYMSYFVTTKNIDDFVWFLKKLEGQDSAKLVITNLVTDFSSAKQREIPKDVIAELIITPDLTRQVQFSGLDSQSTFQVFNAEYSRMIEEAYKIIDTSDAANVQAKTTQIRTWLSLNMNRLSKETSLSRLSDLGKNLWRAGFEGPAQEVYDFVAIHGSQDLREDAWFYRLWISGSQEDWKTSLKWIETNKLNSQFKAINDSRLKFWIAYVYQKNEKESDAREFWEQTIEEHPLSFYAIMATKALRKFHPKSKLIEFYSKIDENNTPTIAIKGIDPSVLEAWKRVRVWARLDSKAFLNAEVSGFEKNFIPGIASRFPKDLAKNVQSDCFLITAALIGAENNYLDSFKVIYRALTLKSVYFNRYLLEILYPRPYYSQLNRSVTGQEIDPLVLLSLIRQESVFNPNARSRVGARGLMQLMPATAKRFKKGLRETHLATPQTNMEIGTKYFQQLIKRYQGNLVFVLASYNAGENRVERWKGQYFKDDMLSSIENIPFLETRNYVKLIFRNLYFYKVLEDKKELTDKEAFNAIFDVTVGFNS
ncbi:MAG: lytic transglycosylase domain-containing protein [Proteobacteria bacterium]|jgi:soluble lytic murein transglycosylase|nr:lytic transglycosylase domain-containing protein [Pseudomonadota bacterium]